MNAVFWLGSSAALCAVGLASFINLKQSRDEGLFLLCCITAFLAIAFTFATGYNLGVLQ